MLFNSIEYLLFFPVVLFIFFSAVHRFRWAILLLSSCIFYAAFIPAYLLILFAVILVDYFAAIAIERSEGNKRRRFLILSVTVTCALLFVFKYFNFFSFNVHRLSELLGWNYSATILSLALPIGLSFHTFQSLSYVIEVYRGNQKAERHFGIYSLYVMFFPQLVAGPIERPQNLLHQFHEPKTFSYDDMVRGLRLILLGLFKKMVIADSLAPYVNEVYKHPGVYGGNMSLLAVILFSIQIYCDFSGYSDIAIGSARCMGFKLMKNFDQPYFSYSITEFWRRWHISLSTWFSDYLFTPIATNLRDWGKRAVVFGLFFTFFISGLWHGAGWTYIIWGLLHGLAMSYEFLTKKVRKKVFKKLPVWLGNSIGMLLTFSYVTFALIFFRASSVQNSISIIGSVSFHPATFISELNALVAKLNEEIDVNAYWQYTGWMLLLFVFIELIYRRSEWPDILQKMPRPARWVVYYSIIACIFLFGVYKVTPNFIYFQF